MKSKNCEACGSKPAITFNTLVWFICCSNPDCPEPESVIGIEDINQGAAIKTWNTVVCPSVRNKYEEAYEREISDNS